VSTAVHVSNDVRRRQARQRRLYRDAAVVDPSSSATRPLVSTETRDPHTAQGAVELVPGWLTGGRAAQALADPAPALPPQRRWVVSRLPRCWRTELGFRSPIR